ncbi:MAG: hypothetical protein QW478_10075 [Candidatus Micrarchaeaceae archaeon]
MVSTFSIQQNLTSGSNTITLPQTGITLKGISCLGIPYMAFNLSTGKTAYVPLGNASGIGGASFKDPMFRVHYTFDDITFTVVVPNTPSSPAVFYFGDPEDDSIALEDLTGVLGTAQLTQGSTAGVMSTSINFSLPEGRIMLTGIYSYVSANYSLVSFPVSTGKILTLFNSNKVGNDTIHPIAVEGSQSFSVNVSGYVNASATNTYYVILYYKVLA